MTYQIIICNCLLYRYDVLQITRIIVLSILHELYVSINHITQVD